MKDELKSIISEQITDNQARPSRSYSPRELQVETMEGVVSIVMGVRRCGKSTLMETIMEGLVQKGVSRENIVWLNFSDERLIELHHGGWEAIHNAYYSTYPEKRQKEKVYFFFDEIQIFPNWELFVERLRRDENCSIYITGSSARMLSREIGTALRGRTLSWELFPFSFNEYLIRKGITSNVKGSDRRLSIQKAWQQYKTEGGFPGVFEAPAPLRRQLHQEYFNALLLRDVIERYDIRYPQVLKHLANRTINSIGSLFSVRKVHEEAKSLGYSVSRETITQFLQWLEDAYFIFSIPAYSASIAKQAREFRKIYCVDHAMAASLSTQILKNHGQILENIIFCALRRLTMDIFYFKTMDNYEVDFIAILKNGEKMLVQVSHDMSSQDTRSREIRALTAAMKECRLQKGFIITENHRETLHKDEGELRILPPADFLENIARYA